MESLSYNNINTHLKVFLIKGFFIELTTISKHRLLRYKIFRKIQQVNKYIYNTSFTTFSSSQLHVACNKQLSHDTKVVS